MRRAFCDLSGPAWMQGARQNSLKNFANLFEKICLARRQPQSLRGHAEFLPSDGKPT